jgi:hypothetical protein
MIEVSMRKDDVADLLALQIAARHRKAARIQGNPIVNNETDQMLPL